MQDLRDEVESVANKLANLRHEGDITLQERNTLKFQIVTADGQYADLREEKKALEAELVSVKKELQFNLKLPKELEVPYIAGHFHTILTAIIQHSYKRQERASVQFEAAQGARGALYCWTLSYYIDSNHTIFIRCWQHISHEKEVALNVP